MFHSLQTTDKKNNSMSFPSLLKPEHNSGLFFLAEGAFINFCDFVVMILSKDISTTIKEKPAEHFQFKNIAGQQHLAFKWKTKQSSLTKQYFKMVNQRQSCNNLTRTEALIFSVLLKHSEQRH